MDDHDDNDQDGHEDPDDQDHSPAVGIAIAWAGKYGTSWEYDTHSSNRIRLTFEAAGLVYTATAAEEQPVCLTLRVTLPLVGIVDELRVHRTLVAVMDGSMNGAVFYRHDQAVLVWRDSFVLDDEDLEDVEAGVKSVAVMFGEAVATFDKVRKKLADLMHHTASQADLSVMPAHGRA